MRKEVKNTQIKQSKVSSREIFERVGKREGEREEGEGMGMNMFEATAMITL